MNGRFGEDPTTARDIFATTGGGGPGTMTQPPGERSGGGRSRNGMGGGGERRPRPPQQHQQHQQHLSSRYPNSQLPLSSNPPQTLQAFNAANPLPRSPSAQRAYPNASSSNQPPPQSRHPPSSGSPRSGNSMPGPSGGGGGGAERERVRGGRYARTAAPGSDFDRRLPVKPSSGTEGTADEGGSSGGDIRQPRQLFNPSSSDKPHSVSPRTREAVPSGSSGPPASSQQRRAERNPPSHPLSSQPPHGKHVSPPTSNPNILSLNPPALDHRQLFDPRLHDPVKFARSAPSVNSNSTGTNSTGTTHLHSTTGSHSTGLTSVPESSKDAAAGDKERERRKRREGSERRSKNGDRERGERDETKSRSSEGSESLKDQSRGKGGDTGVLGSLREQYRGIQALEANLIDIHRKMGRDETITLANGAKIGPGMGDEGWVELCGRHMKLAHAHHDFLGQSLDPRLPASLHSLPVKYNIPARLWQNGFHLLIERMRTTWLAPSLSPSRDLSSNSASAHAAASAAAAARALEHLTDYILDAYSFYTALLDEQVLGTFRSAWIEALGDLARYRMAVANHVAVSAAASTRPAAVQPKVLGRIDDDDDFGDGGPPMPSGNSIGKEVADSWDVEDRETWRTTARDWYAIGVGEKPGEGRLHHRLALISRDVKGEEERALYHFSKSLITNNPFAASRESILPLFDTALQSKRFHPDATAAELFVLLHGMIFTKIQLDDFDDIFARFFERLEEDRLGTKSLPQVEWVMMGVINLAACLQYGVEDGLLRKASAEETSRRGGGRKEVVEPAGPQAIMMHAGGGGAKKAEGEEGDGSDEGLSASGTQPPPSAAEGEVRSLVRKIFSAEDVESLPLPFRHALRLSFSILSFCLAHPIRKDTLSNAIINPYIPIFLTFLSTVVKQPAALALVERNVPWDALVLFFNTIPRKIEVRMDVSPKLTAGGGGPLPEDWCLRGMEWVGRRVFERGFWKQSSMSSSGRKGGGGAAPPDLNGLPRSTNTIQSEMDVLAVEMETLDVEQQLREGIVDGEGDSSLEAQELTSKRWKRIAWSVGVFVRQVPGLGIEASNGRKVRIEEGGALRGKMEGWEEERRRSREADEAAEEKKRKDEDARGLASTGGSGGDEAWLEEEEEPTDEDDEQDPELRELKAQRRNLQAILRASRNPKSSTQNLPPLSSFRNPRPPKPPSSNKNLPHVIPGYTVLVFDTNVLLSSLPLFTALVESARWTAMVPLPVITELDGLSNQPPPLGTEASKALSYLTVNIRSHSRTLKVQTSRGNYLSDLTIRTEDISFSGSSSSTMHGGQLGERARNMDDLILRACGFQEEHFVDRTGILGVSDGLRAEEKEKAAKVVLLTFDRNLRLRAKARGVESVDEKGMKKILAVAG